MSERRDVDDVLARYRRATRLGRLALFLALAAVLVAAALELSLAGLLAVGLGLLVAIRLPVLQTGGTATLATAADPDAVRAAFRGERPPVLVYQWGVADAVRSSEDGVVYEHSSLFGLRTATVAVETTETEAGLALLVTVDGTAWARYDVAVAPTDDGTRIDVEAASERRVALRRLPDWVVGQRYRTAALAAQGYEVRDRSRSLALWRGQPS